MYSEYTLSANRSARNLCTLNARTAFAAVASLALLCGAAPSLAQTPATTLQSLVVVDSEGQAHLVIDFANMPSTLPIPEWLSAAVTAISSGSVARDGALDPHHVINVRGATAQYLAITDARGNTYSVLRLPAPATMVPAWIDAVIQAVNSEGFTKILGTVVTTHAPPTPTGSTPTRGSA